MWFDSSQAEEALTPCAVTVSKIITVRADAEYDITASGRIASGLIAVRTINGGGWLGQCSGLRHELSANSLLILPWTEIMRFATDGSKWRFWWVEFDIEGALPLETGKVYEMPFDRSEEDVWAESFLRLRSARAADRRFASSAIIWLLHRWSAIGGEETPSRRSAKDRAVERAVEAMRRTLDQSASVGDWATASGYGVKRFCQIFRELTGVAPKQYYDRMRLKHAAELMRHGGLNISETADRLGFSSPFHLSSAFTRHFGKSPRHWLRSQ